MTAKFDNLEVLLQLHRLGIIIHSHCDRRMRPYKLRMSEFTTLLAISRRPHITHLDLAHRLGIRRQSVATCLTALEKKGLITRTVNGPDFRIRNLEATAKGRAVCDQILRGVNEYEQRLFIAMGSEQYAGLGQCATACRRALTHIPYHY